MMDIIGFSSDDLQLFNTEVEKAKNVLSTQIQSLEYLQEFGIDLRFFLGDEFKIQNESFKSYLIQSLANYGINVASLTDTTENLFNQYVFNLVPPETNDGLIAR